MQGMKRFKGDPIMISEIIRLHMECRYNLKQIHQAINRDMLAFGDSVGFESFQKYVKEEIPNLKDYGRRQKYAPAQD